MSQSSAGNYGSSLLDCRRSMSHSMERWRGPPATRYCHSYHARALWYTAGFCWPCLDRRSIRRDISCTVCILPDVATSPTWSTKDARLLRLRRYVDCRFVLRLHFSRRWISWNLLMGNPATDCDVGCNDILHDSGSAWPRNYSSRILTWFTTKAIIQWFWGSSRSVWVWSRLGRFPANPK